MRLEWGEEDPGLSPRPEPPSLDLHCHRTGHVVGLGPAEVWGGRRGDSRGRARRARWAVRFRSSSLSWPGDECLPPVLGLRRRRATGTPIRTPRFPRPRARGGKGRLRAAARGPRLPLTLRVRVKETPSAAPTPRSPPGPDAWAPVPRPLEESRSHRLPPWGTTWDSRLREPETETPATLPTRRRRLQPVSPERPEKPRLRDTVSAQESEAKPGKIQRPTPRAPTPRSRGRRGLAPHFAGPERPLAPGAGSSSRAVRGPRAVLRFRLEGQVTWDR